jgi:virulence-associated protein VagC
VEFELPGDEAIMHRDGDRLVIEPVRKRGLVALLKAMKPLAEDFPEIDDSVPANVLDPLHAGRKFRPARAAPYRREPRISLRPPYRKRSRRRRDISAAARSAAE